MTIKHPPAAQNVVVLKRADTPEGRELARLDKLTISEQKKRKVKP